MGRLLDALRRLEERQTADGARSVVSSPAAEAVSAAATTAHDARGAQSQPRPAADQVLEELLDIGCAAQQAVQSAAQPVRQHAAHGAALDLAFGSVEPWESPSWPASEAAEAQAEACPPLAPTDPGAASAPAEEEPIASGGPTIDPAPTTPATSLDGAAAPTDFSGTDTTSATDALTDAGSLPIDSTGRDDAFAPTAAAGDETSPHQAASPCRAALVDQAAVFNATPLSDATPSSDDVSFSDDVPSSGATALSDNAALPNGGDRDSRFDRLVEAVLERWNNALPVVLLIVSVGEGPPPKWPAALARRLQAAVGSSVSVREASELTASDVLDLRRRYQLALISASAADANIAPLAAESDGAYLCVRIGSDRLGDIERTAAQILARGGLIAGLIAE